MPDIAIRVSNLSKCYQIYDNPRDRLKQFVIPKLCTLIPPLRKFITLKSNSSPLPLEPCPLNLNFYKEFWALKDVSFEIKKGETVGIIGRNGSGKSTLLQMICGTLFPTNGNVQTNGRVAALLELGSGFNPEFTGRENVYLNGTVLGLSKEEIDARFDEIAAFADIGDFIEQPVKTYSSGMFVRLAFAIQANVDPEILIVDEALAVGDAYFVHRCMLRFNELQKSGTTILFVSHDANSVRNLCSRAIWLVDGGIKQQGSSSKVVEAYLAHLFGRQIVTTEPKTAFNATDVDREINPSMKMETSIPNIDRRLGDQKCQIIGVGLYDEAMNRISSTLNDKIVTLRLTIKNNFVEPDIALVVGYVFRNSRGQEIASTNSQIEGLIIDPMAKGSHLTVRITVTLPRLHPGCYAFSPTAGYVDNKRGIILSDRIENAVAFDILSSKEMHTMMAFPSVIEIEYGRGS